MNRHAFSSKLNLYNCIFSSKFYVDNNDVSLNFNEDSNSISTFQTLITEFLYGQKAQEDCVVSKARGGLKNVASEVTALHYTLEKCERPSINAHF